MTQRDYHEKPMTLDELGCWQRGLHDGELHALAWFTHPWRFRRWLTGRYFWRMVRESRRLK